MEWKTIDRNWMFLVHPALTVLLTAAYQGQETITPMAWLMPLSGEPPLVALSMKRTRFAYELLKASSQFALNLPTIAEAKKVWACGVTSGRTRDKFALTGFTRLEAGRINAPLVAESAAILECQLSDDRPYGDHQLLVGEILLARVRADLYDEEWSPSFLACLHLRKEKFIPPDWSRLTKG
ncbi:MAG: flavin reductase family protein [Coprothermobacterota bacterium]|nr:flavin reductase family protein [Coprothermobacterota bacterium]